MIKMKRPSFTPTQVVDIVSLSHSLLQNIATNNNNLQSGGDKVICEKTLRGEGLQTKINR